MDPLRIDISTLIASAQERLLATVPCLIDHVDREALRKNVPSPSLRKTPINVHALWKRTGPDATWGANVHRTAQPQVRMVAGSAASILDSAGTQSKLKVVRAAIQSGDQLGVTAILVEPDSMRLSAEEELIKRNSLSAEHLRWNRKARQRFRRAEVRMLLNSPAHHDLIVHPKGGNRNGNKIISCSRTSSWEQWISLVPGQRR